MATGLLASALCASHLTAESFTPDKRVVYKTIDGTELKLHCFLPARRSDSATRPAIVFFFGGGWNSGTPKQFYPHCSYLASRGMVAMSADYRVFSRNQTSPRECVMDGKSAIRWIRSHANELGVDADRLAAGGGSAGGHVAAAAATTRALNDEQDDPNVSCIPDALVLFNPVFDNGPEGYGHGRFKDYWQDISPLHNIHVDTPPTAVFLGTHDNIIPVTTAERYKARMAEYGLRCDLYLYEGKGHGFFNFRNREDFIATVSEMDRFLTSLGYLEGEPDISSGANRVRRETRALRAQTKAKD